MAKPNAKPDVGGKFNIMSALGSAGTKTPHQQSVKTLNDKNVKVSKPPARVTAYIEADLYEEMLLFIAKNKSDGWNLKEVFNEALKVFLAQQGEKG
jgi:hypothetical protein